MADAFNLTAQLNLRGPSNIKTVVADIRRQIGTVNADLKFKIDPTTTRNLAQLNSTLRNFNSTLNSTQTSATNAARAISSLGRAVNGINIKNLPQQINSAANAVGKLSSASASNTKALQTASTEMQEFGKQAYLAVRRFAAFSGVTGVIFSVTGAIQKGVEAFIEYDRQFVKLQQVTGESADGLQNLSKTITSLATGLGVASSDITEVASTLAQAGLSARDTERALKALALSSLAPSFDDMNETVEGSIALMRQFGINAGQLEGALGSVNAVAAKFAVEASDIITAIQRTGGVFATASKGVSEGTDALNEFVAVFTSVRATTRESAETIATGLRTIFTRIQRGSTIEALKEYGVNLTDLDGKFVGAYKAVELLSQGLNKIDPRDLKFSNIVEELGGFRQIGKVIPLIQQFATAQDALKVAQRGQGSLALDAAKAQDSLSNKIVKVKEEFFALFREIGNSDGFQTLIRGALDLSSALIKIADSIKGVLPALGIFAAFKGVSALTQFTSGFVGSAKVRQKSDGGPIRKFATGGLVPGQGNTDTVPAMLTPGEFVIRKKAVAAIGSQNLHKMNKYADGGTIKQLKGSGNRGFGKKTIQQYQKDNPNIEDDDYINTASTKIIREKMPLSVNDFANSLPDVSKKDTLLRKQKSYDAQIGNIAENLLIKKLGVKKYQGLGTKSSNSSNAPIDLIDSENLYEVKFKNETTTDAELYSKLLRYKLEQQPEVILQQFKEKVLSKRDGISLGSIRLLEAGDLRSQVDAKYRPKKPLSQDPKNIKRREDRYYDRAVENAIYSRYSYGGSVNAPLIDDILDNAKGSILPSKVALEKLIQTGYGALDFDRTLKRTTGDAAYAKAKTPQAKDAVLSKYFRDRSTRLSDAKNSRLTQFGKALQEAIKNKQIDPNNLSIISKSSRVPGLAEHINELFGIPAANMVFTSGGSKEPALEAMRNKGPRVNRVFKNLGGFIQKFSVGGGVKDLASMIPSEILAEAKKYGIDVPFTTRDVLRKRKALSSTDSLIKQGLLEQITQARGAAANKAQSDSEIAARRKIAVVGITGDRTEQEILTPGFTDKQSGQSVRGVPATLQSGALPPSLAKRVQALIRGRIENLVRDVGIQIARSAGTSAITDKKAIRNIASKDIEDIAGSIFEKALGAAGGNYDPLSKAIDFPSGLNQQISSLLGVDSGVMTDATYNATSAAAKRKVAKGQFDRGRLEARSRFGRSQFALGGTVQKFASGGEAQTPQLYTRGSLTYSIDDMKNAAQRNGMTLEQLKALLEERQDNDWKDFVIPYYDLEKRFGLTTYKPQDTNLFQKVMAAKIDKEDRIETWKQKQGLATRDYEGRSERQKGFLSARKQRRGFAVGGSVGKGLGSKIYDLQKGTGLSDREFNELVYFAKTNDFNEQQFKNYLSSHLQNKQRKQALGTDTEALRRSLLGGATTTSSQMLLAQQLMGAPDAKWNPKYDKARFAVGGSVEDTVPALLTPGEFVINKKAAQRIGTGKLHQLNRADKIQGFNKGGVVQRFAKGGQAYTQNVARSADISIKQANPLQGLGLLFGDIEKMSQKLPASAGLIKNLDKTLGQLGQTFGTISQKSGVTIQQLRKAIEADLAKAHAANASASKIDKLKTALQTLNDVQDTAANKLADSRSSRISLTKDRFSNAIDRTPILGTVSRFGKGLGGEKGYYMSMGVGMLAGQGENLFGKENGRRTNTGMLARTGANNAFTSSGVEAGASTLSAGLATASSLAMIPGVGPFAAALVGGVTVIKAWTNAVEAGKKAAEEFANQEREKKILDTQDAADKVFQDYQKDPSLANRQKLINLNTTSSREIIKDTRSDIKRSDDEFSRDTNNRNWTQWWNNQTPTMDPKKRNELIDAKAKENAQKADVSADRSRQILESKVASGTKVSDLAALPEFKQLALSIAAADVEFQKLIAESATKSEADQKAAEQQGLNSVITKILNDAQLKTVQKSKEIADAFDEINRRGRDLAANFDRMVNSFNQALGRATYELEQMDKLSEGRSAALQGNASVLNVSSRDSNILKNPKAYSEAEKESAIDRASSLFGKDKKMVKDMLGINAKDFARSMTQAVEKDLKGVKIGEGNANLSLKDAASTARKNLSSQLAGAPEDVRNQILSKFDNMVDSIDDDKDLKGKGPQEKVNILIDRIEGQLGGAAIEGGEKIQQMALAMLDFKNGALNEFINATNKAAEAQLRAQKAAFDAEDIVVKGRDNLNSVLGRSGPTPVDIKARQDARIAQLSGGPTDPIQIRENIQKDITAQSAKQKELDQNTDPGKEKQLVQDISDLSLKIKKGQEALDQLANSTEVASAALNKIQEIQQAMEGQGDFLDKLATATPEEAEKLGQAFMRLQNNLNGGINTIRNSREAQIAYIKTLRETGNPMMAQRASMGVLAQQRAETMSLFKELIPVFQAQNKSPEQIAEMGARLRQGTYTESGIFNNPMLAPLAKQQVDFTRDPMSDPRIAANAALYNQAINKQAEARFQQGALEVYDAGLIMQDATTRFDTAVTRLQTYLENIRSGERPATAAVPKAKGGPIYASSGTLVNFQPKGTDTVPAMLTPGEFVVNAKATARHLPLLKSINSGEDVSGYNHGGVVYLVKGGRLKQDATIDQDRAKFEADVQAQGANYGVSQADQQEAIRLRDARVAAEQEEMFLADGAMVDYAARHWTEHQFGAEWGKMTEEQRNAEIQKNLPRFQQLGQDYTARRDAYVAQKGAEDEATGLWSKDRFLTEHQLSFFRQERERSEAAYAAAYQTEYDQQAKIRETNQSAVSSARQEFVRRSNLEYDRQIAYGEKEVSVPEQKISIDGKGNFTIAEWKPGEREAFIQKRKDEALANVNAEEAKQGLPLTGKSTATSQRDTPPVGSRSAVSRAESAARRGNPYEVNVGLFGSTNSRSRLSGMSMPGMGSFAPVGLNMSGMESSTYSARTDMKQYKNRAEWAALMNINKEQRTKQQKQRIQELKKYYKQKQDYDEMLAAGRFLSYPSNSVSRAESAARRGNPYEVNVGLFGSTNSRSRLSGMSMPGMGSFAPVGLNMSGMESSTYSARTDMKQYKNRDITETINNPNGKMHTPAKMADFAMNEERKDYWKKQNEASGIRARKNIENSINNDKLQANRDKRLGLDKVIQNKLGSEMRSAGELADPKLKNQFRTEAINERFTFESNRGKTAAIPSNIDIKNKTITFAKIDPKTGLPLTDKEGNKLYTRPVPFSDLKAESLDRALAIGPIDMDQSQFKDKGGYEEYKKEYEKQQSDAKEFRTRLKNNEDTAVIAPSSGLSLDDVQKMQDKQKMQYEQNMPTFEVKISTQDRLGANIPDYKTTTPSMTSMLPNVKGLAKPETSSKPYQDPLNDKGDTILKNKEEKQRQDEAKAKEEAATRQAEQAAANQAKEAQAAKDKQDSLWVNSSNPLTAGLGYLGGLGESAGNIAYGAANVVSGAATVAASPVLGYFAGNSAEEAARGKKLEAQTRMMQEKQASMGVLGPQGTDQQEALSQAQKSDYRGESSTAAAARVGAKAMAQGAYTAVEAAQAVAGQGPIMTGDKTWLNQGDDERVQQAGPYGGATRIAQNIGFTASQGVQVAAGLGMTTGTSIAGKAGKVLGAVDDVLSNPVGAAAKAAKGAKGIVTKAPDFVRSVDDKLTRRITGMTPEEYRASQRTRSGALKSDVKARAANRKAEQWIEDTSKEFFRQPGETTTRNYGFSGFSPDTPVVQSKYPSYTASLKQIDEMRKPGGANSIDIDENARWKFGDEDLQLGTSTNRNSSAIDTIDPLKANAAEAMARQAEKPQVSLVKPRNIEISDEANDVLSFMNDMKASERSTTKADISTNIPINKAQQETVVRSSAKPVTTTPIKTKRQNSNVRLSDMQNLSDSAQKYLSSMPQTQRDAFEALSFNVNKNKQEIFLRDIIEKAAVDDLRWLDDPGSASGHLDKVANKWSKYYQTMGTKDLSSMVKKARGVFTKKGSLPGADSRPVIAINSAEDVLSTGVHESTHFAADMVDKLNVNYKDLTEMVDKNLLDSFLDTDYDKIIQGLKTSYSSKFVKNSSNAVAGSEFFTTLNQAAVDPRTKDLFAESPKAKEILSKMWKAHGYSTGGIVYASDGGLISESQRNIIDKIIKSRSSSYGYSGTMSLGLSLLNAANISGDINSNKFDKDKTKKTLISLVENNELRKQQLRKNDINTKNKPKKYSVGGIVYANNGALIEAQNQGSDTVPAMLTPGEFVINRESAQKHMPVLHAINNGHYNRGGMIEYLNNGGVVGPKYYANGGINPVEAARQMSANRGANGVNTSGNSSGTNSAIQQEPEWLSKLDETVNGIKESLGGMYSNLNNVANQLTNVAQELPREMSITSNVNKNVNVNGIAGEWNKYQGDVLKMAGEQASKTIQDDKVKLAKWSEGAIPVIG